MKSSPPGHGGGTIVTSEVHVLIIPDPFVTVNVTVWTPESASPNILGDTVRVGIPHILSELPLSIIFGVIVTVQSEPKTAVASLQDTCKLQTVTGAFKAGLAGHPVPASNAVNVMTLGPPPVIALGSNKPVRVSVIPKPLKFSPVMFGSDTGGIVTRVTGVSSMLNGPLEPNDKHWAFEFIVTNNNML